MRASELAGELAIVEHRVNKMKSRRPDRFQSEPLVEVAIDGKIYDVTEVKHNIYADTDGTSHVALLQLTERKF